MTREEISWDNAPELTEQVQKTKTFTCKKLKKENTYLLFTRDNDFFGKAVDIFNKNGILQKIDLIGGKRIWEYLGVYRQQITEKKLDEIVYEIRWKDLTSEDFKLIINILKKDYFFIKKD